MHDLREATLSLSCTYALDDGRAGWIHRSANSIALPRQDDLPEEQDNQRHDAKKGAQQGQCPRPVRREVSDDFSVDVLPVARRRRRRRGLVGVGGEQELLGAAAHDGCVSGACRRRGRRRCGCFQVAHAASWRWGKRRCGGARCSYKVAMVR